MEDKDRIIEGLKSRVSSTEEALARVEASRDEKYRENQSLKEQIKIYRFCIERLAPGITPENDKR